MKYFLFTAFLLTFTLTASAQKSIECFVKGTVIDTANNPVPNAYIVLDSPPVGFEDLIVFDKADKDGNFSYSTRCPFPNGQQTLYIASPILIENFSPFEPPFRTNQLGKPFAGQIIVNKNKSDINLGNVYVQVYYAAVNIKFVDDAGKFLETDKDVWKKTQIRVRSKKKIVAGSALFRNAYEKAVRAAESSVKMNLPEGKWTIEISFNGKKWLKPDRVLTVKRSDAPVEETLTMRD